MKTLATVVRLEANPMGDLKLGGCCTCLCCRADKLSLLVKALEDIAGFADEIFDAGFIADIARAAIKEARK